MLGRLEEVNINYVGMAAVKLPDAITQHEGDVRAKAGSSGLQMG